jgi:hypothetical protein
VFASAVPEIQERYINILRPIIGRLALAGVGENPPDYSIRDPWQDEVCATTSPGSQASG